MSKLRSPLWYELPILFSIIGGIIAYFAIRHDDPKKAKNCIILSIILIIPALVLLTPFAVTGLDKSYFIVASDSMEPVLQVNETVRANTDIPFEDIEVGDIIVFHRPLGDDRTIVHRVVEIINEEPKALRTQGDANPASIPGTDFPITEEEYIGKVDTIIPFVSNLVKLKESPIVEIITISQVVVLIIPIVMHVRFVRSRKINE